MCDWWFEGICLQTSFYSEREKCYLYLITDTYTYQPQVELRTQGTFQYFYKLLMLWPPGLSDYHWAASLSEREQLKFCFLVWNLWEFSFLFCKFDISSNLSFIEEKFIKVCLKDRIENCFSLQIITELPRERKKQFLAL